MVELGFGALRVEKLYALEELVQSFLFFGGRWIDTSVLYTGMSSAIGNLPEEFRGLLNVQLKIPMDEDLTPTRVRFYFEHSLRQLKLKNRLGCLMAHDVRGVKWGAPLQAFLEVAHKLREQGEVGKIGISSHGTSDRVIYAMQHGGIDRVMVPLHIFDTSYFDVFAQGPHEGVECVAMSPYAGGRVFKLHGCEQYNSHCFLFVALTPNVSMVFSRMHTGPQIMTNHMRLSGLEKFSMKEIAPIVADLQKRYALELPKCTGCQYCLPCPQGIPIDVRMQQGGGDSRCIACGECAERCPQRLDIPKEMRRCSSV